MAPQPGPVWHRARRRQDHSRLSAVALPAVGPVLTAAARGALADPRSGRRNGASIEQRNWLLMPCQTDHLSQLANVTVTIAAGGENMPRLRIGAVPMTPAERQARRRARLRRNKRTPRDAVGATHPTATPALGGGGGGADRAPGRIPRLARQSTGQPGRLEAGREADTLSSSSISRSCRRSTYRAATAATDTGGSPPASSKRHGQIAELDAHNFHLRAGRLPVRPPLHPARPSGCLSARHSERLNFSLATPS